jgi:hypothetical protein
MREKKVSLGVAALASTRPGAERVPPQAHRSSLSSSASRPRGPASTPHRSASTGSRRRRRDELCHGANPGTRPRAWPLARTPELEEASAHAGRCSCSWPSASGGGVEAEPASSGAGMARPMSAGTTVEWFAGRSGWIHGRRRGGPPPLCACKGRWPPAQPVARRAACAPA